MVVVIQDNKYSKISNEVDRGTMHFCDVCENMMYLNISTNDNEEDKLSYFCQKCGTNKTNLSKNEEMEKTEESLIYFKDFDENTGSTNVLNEYTKHDPTIPETDILQCPNDECETNKNSNVNSKISYVRYDNKNMKYVYLCKLCNTSWESIHLE